MKKDAASTRANLQVKVWEVDVEEPLLLVKAPKKALASSFSLLLTGGRFWYGLQQKKELEVILDY